MEEELDTCHEVIAMLCSIISELIEANPQQNRFATRLLSVLGSEKIPQDRRTKIIHELYQERFPENDDDENLRS